MSKATATKPLKFKSDTKLGRMFKDIYHGEDMDTERCKIILMLATEAPFDVEAWTEEQRRHAANWAMREHLNAAGNPTVRLIKPEFLK